MVTDAEEKSRALEAITEHIVPGRWADCRWPNELELKATSVLKLAINEASAKIRTGDPVDDDDDHSLDFLAGVLPLKLTADAPQPDAKLTEGIEPPSYITNYKRDGRK